MPDELSPASTRSDAGPGAPNRIPVPSNCLTPRRQWQTFAPPLAGFLATLDTCMSEAPG